jgi:hypothetical protein
MSHISIGTCKVLIVYLNPHVSLNKNVRIFKISSWDRNFANLMVSRKKSHSYIVSRLVIFVIMTFSELAKQNLPLVELLMY